MAFWNRKEKNVELTPLQIHNAKVDLEAIEEFKQAMRQMTEAFNKAAIDLSKGFTALNKSLNQNTAELKKQKRI